MLTNFLDRNYWGGSYGSILGNYLVNMYAIITLYSTFVDNFSARLPDRVGYVAIDGIASSVVWSGEF